MSLVINYIEIENFKSYYGKNILGPFHQSFNAVIGPNGSGKSNVIDSLLFVFGFRAQKIRTKKISVLIHNSDQHPNVNSCSVTIFFRKVKETTPNKFEVVPDSEFTVKRTAYKDNSSEYYLDNRKVQFKEVGALLRECGVDLDHNRFLILQGEVESISLLKPKAANEHEEGLLEYLEDIIGTIKYKPMLEEATQKIEQVNEIRTEKANRVQNLQKDKNNLEGPKNEAINYLKLENKLIETKNIYYQLKIHETGESVGEQKEECNEIEKQYAELNKKLTDLKQENETQSNECNLKKKELEKKTKASDKLKKRIEDLEKEEVELKEGLKHAKDNIKKLEKNIETEEEKLEKLKGLPEKNEARIEELKEELAELEEKVEPANELIQTKMDQVNKETLKYQDKKNSLQENLNKLQSDANEAKSKMEVAQSELDVFLKNQNYDQGKLEETRAKLEEVAKVAIEKENAINDLEKSKIPKLERDLKKATDELDDLSGKEKKISESLNKHRQKFADAQSSFSRNQGRNKVLQFLTKLKNEGRLNGFYGRLGDLGAIDEKYDVAVSTACGALDNLVVDTIDTAQQCVEYLKQSQVGAATFIALDKQEKWREHVNNRSAQYPESAKRLVDLIEVREEKFLTAFYYSLRNTLVANDLEQATRIAYNHSQRNRVVTLKGEIIEVSGTMSGGGQPLKGRMGSTIVAVEEFSAESIRMMQESVRDDEVQLRAVVDRRVELDTAVQTLKTQLDRAKVDLASFRTELSSAREQIKEYKKFEIVCLKKAKEAVCDEAKQAKLQEVVDKCRALFEKADEKAAKLRDENNELHEKIVEISKKILDEPKAALKKIETRITECNKEITNLTVEIKTSKRNLTNCEKKLTSMRDDIETHQKNLSKCEQRMESIDDDRKEATEAHTALQEELQELESEVREMLKCMKQSDQQTQKFEAERIDVKHKLDELSEKLRQAEHQVKHYEGLLSALKLHNIKELERIGGRRSDSMVGDDVELKKLDEDDLTGLDDEHLKKEIHKLQESLNSQQPNLAAIQNYKELEVKFMERVAELEEISQERDKLVSDYEEIRKRRFEEFMKGFTEIRLKLKEIYRTVTIEGDAELELVDSMDPFTEGIVLSVRPPKKSWKNISNLSGGEKTLSSLSLVFALHEFRATPIYVMDEIDAALDFKNVSIIAHYIKERTKNAQFIIISLRNNMFELCNRLFGIYKVRNCTSATYIAPDLIELDEKKKQAANKQLKENSRPEIEAAATVEDKERQELNTTHDHTIRTNLNATNINA